MNRQRILLIGLNHHTAGVDVRERYALSGVDDMCERIVPGDEVNTGPAREALVLSTCNRVEILAVGDERYGLAALRDHVLETWAEATGQDPCELIRHVYVHENDDAVRHLYTVAASLDSMVLGEPQILGQLKDAYRDAVDKRTAHVIVNRMLHKAFFTAKRVRSETCVASSAVSISYAAVELAKKIFGDMTGKRAMLVGAGEMAELAATHLVNAGVEKIRVINRTLPRARELVCQLCGGSQNAERGEATTMEQLYEMLDDTDIVISSTGAPNAIISASQMKPVLRARKFRPMFFIDIAVPRDIDPDVNALDNVYLYDIDDLQEVVEENLATRRDEADKARLIVDEEVEKFAGWVASLDVQPTIVSLLEMSEDVAMRELTKTLRRMGPHMDAEQVEMMETLVRSIARKLCHKPITFLKRRATEEDAGRRFVDVTRRMFDLDDDRVPANAHAARRVCIDHSLEDEPADDSAVQTTDGPTSDTTLH